MKHVVLLKSKAGVPGGLEKYASRIVRAFLDRGAKVSLLTTGPSHDPFQWAGASVYPLETCRWPAFWRMEQYDRFVRRWVKEQKPDLVFGMDRNRSQTHIRAGNGVHAAFLESRIWTEGRMKRWMCALNPLHIKILQFERAAFEHRDLVKLFVNSRMVRDQILRYYRADPAKIEVVHNGVEWSEMEIDFEKSESERRRLMREWNLNPSMFHFLFIGNGYLRKGLAPLLHALARLKERNVHLSIVGKDNRAAEFRKIVSQLGLEKRVRFFGSQKEIRAFYQVADALVIPSFYDPFANVTVEALAMGLFVVSSQSNGGHEILTAENGSVISDLCNVDSVAESLQCALSHPKTKASAQAIRESVRHLDFSRQMSKLIDAC